MKNHETAVIEQSEHINEMSTLHHREKDTAESAMITVSMSKAETYINVTAEVFAQIKTPKTTVKKKKEQREKGKLKEDKR